MITKKMVSDVHQADEKMDKKTKKAKKKNKRVKFALSSPVDLMDSSTTAPADSDKLPNSLSKSRFRFLHRIFGKIRSFCLPSKYLSSEQKNSDTKTEASSSAAVDRSSEEHREADLLAATQETEPITSVVERIKLSPSFDGSFTSIDAFSDEETQETEPFADVAVAPTFAAIDLDCLQEIMDSLGSEPLGNTPTSAPLWVSDLFGQQAATEQDRETQGDDADQAPLGLPNLGNTCYMNSVLQCLLSVSPFREDVLSLQEDWKNEAVLLGALSDLHMSRLDSSDSELKKKLLAKVKGYIENDYPNFEGNQQQDAHEFLMACLFCLKEESEILKIFCPTYTCPVANMEFRLNHECTCDSCGFQKSFPEDFNYLSLVIGPQACLTDSLQQCLNASSIDCACSQCSGTKASETLKFLSLPQVLVFMVMRFDITMCKLKDQLEIPEELTLSCVEGGSTSCHQCTVQTQWCCVAFGKQFVFWTLHQSYS
ncbi:ubiquitin carboxyl-terminal hydrolase 37-like isoform X1 [Ctenopharyngodon idella]|uniref:ubiquitin carboxyl-terminal hydrolase 37-like isoform X1 n=1 Tax=Ctenopharyngodon idella TaxID=7959 RepID=UPI0022327DC5|nr:ubiquitin carboxyl-terminal hydrolase 37-like isoform X1 [Ctenopharyngodon idella]XP_051732464.1 ubiquitin carboxyl-terminal hydrolase 37-like isoform X1 [Ctenopharyngodon idella]XP_051732473.1 ubiquitin carboxyl-terminal hydrolase 37-like isoform X1 [Ctenopharyngodon idella]XP_051732483.1 ubiquitin carboxyl-terminal hydrolase 37-like isoform X1 [Ctenopharyngodon idella]XP_051732491.1 ubiquitin carboxyl-terminal hydrolase 37-like isoform X1 [Ctenopharyngodon idella]